MRATIFFIVIACLKVSAGTFAQTVTYTARNASIKEAFAAIKKQTGFVLMYKASILKEAKPVTVTAERLPVESFLREIFKGQELDYSIQDQTIFVFVKKTAAGPGLAPGVGEEAEGPEREVSGMVTGTGGVPLVGASIKIRGTSKGTSSDNSGKFTLRVTNGQVLVISYIGYHVKTIRIGAEVKLEIQLQVNETALSEIVINKGYYTTSEKANTGSVSRVTSETIDKQPVMNPLQAMEGRMPGVLITQNSGIAGANFVIQIRGQNSLRNTYDNNGNYPLYIIDGVPFISSSMSSVGMGPISQISLNSTIGASPLNSINPKDIESIEVLKDADATSIYGSRGANGVVLITTKKGKAGQMQVDAGFYTGWGKITRRMKLLNTEQYIAMRKEGVSNDGLTPAAGGVDINGTWSQTRYTDWQKVLIGGTAVNTDAQLSLSGGTSAAQYRIAGGYHRETTVFPWTNGDQRANVSTSLTTTNPNQRFKSSFVLNYAYGDSRLPGADLTSTSLTLAPNSPALYDSAGQLNWEKNTFTNPLAATQVPFKGRTLNLITNLNIRYELLPGLSVSANLGYTNMAVKELTKTLKTSYNLQQRLTFPLRSSFGDNSAISWTVEPQINYEKGIGKGRLSALVGSSLQRQTTEFLKRDARGFLSEDFMENITAVPAANIITTYTYNQYRYGAVYGRLGYNWDSRYIVNLSVRRDGSSRFGPGKQFANFGAVGLAWVFSEEKFIKEHGSVLSFGKLRGSYGTTGNDQIQNYGFLNSYSTSGQYQTQPGISPARLYNPDFRWEENKKLEAALELGFFQDRLMSTVAFYSNRSSNQLVGYPLPPTTGFSTIQFNLPATVENRGWEIELNSTNIRKRGLSWTTGFVLTIPKNKLLSYPGLAGSAYANTYVVGEPLSIRRGYQLQGVDPQTGEYKILDVDHNGSYDPADYTTVNFVGQRYYGGLRNTVSYKGFQLEVFFQFVKQNGRNYLGTFYIPGEKGNQPVEVLHRWQKAGDEATLQRFGTNSGSAIYPFIYYSSSNAAYSDASFIRLKNAALSYQLPANVLQKLKMKKLSIYVQAQNLLTITKYKGLDPETQSGLPPLRYIITGVQITL